MDDRFLQAGIKEIPVLDISIYINWINFRYIREMHYYCNIFCKISGFCEIFNSIIFSKKETYYERQNSVISIGFHFYHKIF